MAFISFHCGRDNGSHTDKILTGKFLFSGVCSNYTIQLLEGYIPPDKIVASWKNGSNDSVYTNVFAVANMCDFDKYHLKQGDVFTFELLTPYAQDCPVCFAYYPKPSISNAIKLVKKLH
jgi:hypothetical protein